MMRVAILLPSLNIGGAEILILEEMRHLAQDKRVEFEIILPYEAGSLYEKMEATGVKISFFNAKHTLLSNLITYLKVFNYLRQEQFDILHIHVLYHGVLLGKLARIPNIFTTVHSLRQFSWFEHFYFRLNDKIFGCGEAVTNYLKNFLPKKTVSCINNGLNPHINSRQNGQKNIIMKDGRDIIVVSIGRLAFLKGYSYLIEAMRHVTKKHPFVKLYIAGDGTQKELLGQQIADLGLEENVVLLGQISNIVPLLSEADIYVNSSLREGLPITLLEAMRSSLPIIATDIEGNRGIIKHEETGFIVKPKDPKVLANTILKLIMQPDLRKKLGIMAYRSFIDNYTINKHCEVLLNEYGIG